MFMRYLFLALAICIVIYSCKKSDGNTAPEIAFDKITAAVFTTNTTGVDAPPILTIKLKDEDGDIGFKAGKDTSYVYIKNLNVPPFIVDSFEFPSNLSAVAGRKMDVEVDIDISKKMKPSGARVDTFYFEVFVKDIAKNKSNVIKTTDPILLIRP